jgi:hypothetical protein
MAVFGRHCIQRGQQSPEAISAKDIAGMPYRIKQLLKCRKVDWLDQVLVKTCLHG